MINASFHVLAVELDSGTLFVSDRAVTLGSDIVYAAILKSGVVSTLGGGVEVEAQALPPEAEGQYWVNRQSAVLECSAEMGSVYDGKILFDGMIESQPIERSGALAITLVPLQRNLVDLPAFGIIDTALYPDALPAVVGNAIPLIFGTVDNCPLLATVLPKSTTLTIAATTGDAQLEVADASLLAATGSVVVDGHTYVYTARSGNVLMGVAVQGDHRSGTLVAQSGTAEFMAAGHVLTGFGAIKSASAVSGGAPDTLLEGAAISLSGATAIFPSLPSVRLAGARSNIALQFDAIGAGNISLNGINAIRYAAVQVSANALTLPVNILANSDPLTSVITFARPAERIVKGIYTVAFTVTVGAQIGWARVKIGGDVVWQMEAPASVIYNHSPATILLDTDVDILPVLVEVEQGGSLNQVAVTITSASRVVYTGNLGDANYATLRQPSNNLFRADQLTVNPDLGTIAKAQLIVRWFAGKSGMGVPTVKFGGRTLGVLAQTQLADAALAQNITVDVTSQGAAALPQQNISTTVSGGTVSHTAIAQKAVISSILVPVPNATFVQRGWSKCPSMQGLVGNITARVAFVSDSAANAASIYLAVHFRNAVGADIGYVDNSSTLTNIATNTWEATTTLNSAPDSIFCERALTNLVELSSVTFEWNAKIAETTISNTPASGSSSPLSAQNLGHSGTAVGVTGGNINFSVPAPPRVVNTVFDLAEYTDWAQFTNKQVEISYVGGTGVDLCVVQAYLSIDYDAFTRAAVGTSNAALNATVTGLSGNPADVLDFLSAQCEEVVSQAALNRLRTWCNANQYTFARLLNTPTDALQLFTFAAEQAGVMLARTPDGIAPIRWFDLSGDVTAIAENDALESVTIDWAKRIETEITLKYRQDYNGAGFLRTLIANAGNNLHCKRGEAMLKGQRTTARRGDIMTRSIRASTLRGEVRLKGIRPLNLEAGFIRDDATAARYLADTAHRFAMPRRVISLLLPFTFNALEEGELIEYLPIGKSSGEGIFARITTRADDGGWLRITAEEILT